MLMLFIQYGDREGLEIGLKFKQYLNNKGINSFLAGPGSPDIPVGMQGFWNFIERKILESSIIVSIVTDGFEDSEGVAKELDFRDKNNPTLPIIFYVKYCVDIPDLIHKYQPWIFKFDSNYVGRYFSDWLIDCFKQVNIRIARAPDKVDQIIDISGIIATYVGRVR